MSKMVYIEKYVIRKNLHRDAQIATRKEAKTDFDRYCNSFF